MQLDCLASHSSSGMNQLWDPGPSFLICSTGLLILPHRRVMGITQFSTCKSAQNQHSMDPDGSTKTGRQTLETHFQCNHIVASSLPRFFRPPGQAESV